MRRGNNILRIYCLIKQLNLLPPNVKQVKKNNHYWEILQEDKGQERGWEGGGGGGALAAFEVSLITFFLPSIFIIK